MSRLYVRPGVGLVVCEHSWYETVWQVVLTVGFSVPTCSRTNTDLSVFRKPMRKIYWCLVHRRTRAQHWGSLTIDKIEPQSFLSGLLYWCDWSIIIIKKLRLCSRSHPMTWFIHLVQSQFLIPSLLHRWGYTSTRLLHRPRITSSSIRSTTCLFQGYGG
jgi:hypothetical protein